MTPLFAYLLCVAFAAILCGSAWLLEQTDRGRRFTDRAIRWVLR